MINCERFTSLITDYLDENLDKQQKAEFKNHLQSCKECAAVFERVNSLQQHLKKLPSVKTSPVFDIVLKNRLRRELVKNTTWNLFENPWIKISVIGLSAAAIFLIAFFSLYYPSISSKQQQGFSSTVSNFQTFTDRADSTNLSQQQVEEKIYFVIEEIPADLFMSERQHFDLLFSTNAHSDSTFSSLGQIKQPAYTKSLVTVTF